MQAFKVEINFDEKEGFSKEQLEKDVIKDLTEINLKLYAFDYYKDAEDICPEIPQINRKVSKCILTIEYKDFGVPMIPYHQVVLGGLSALTHKCPYIDLYSITPSFIEFN